MKIRMSLLLGAALGTALLVSCRTPASGLTVESYPQTKVTAKSRMVARHLEVVKSNVERRNDLLVVQITVQNKTQNDVPFEYRFRWLDQQGIAQDAVQSPWMPMSLSARDKGMLKSVAPNKRASDFVVDIRFSFSSARWGEVE